MGGRLIYLCCDDEFSVTEQGMVSTILWSSIGCGAGIYFREDFGLKQPRGAAEEQKSSSVNQKYSAMAIENATLIHENLCCAMPVRSRLIVIMQNDDHPLMAAEIITAVPQ